MNQVAAAKSPRNFPWPKTLAALENNDEAEIDIAFVIVEEIGPSPIRGKHDGSRVDLKEMAGTLTEHLGREVSAGMLARFRSIGTKFERDQIPPGATIGVLEAAKGHPEWLAIASKVALSKGEVLTRAFVREIVKPLDEAARDDARTEKIRGAEEEVAFANKILAESGNTKPLDRATKEYAKAIASKASRAPRLSTLITTSIKAAEMAAKVEGNLHDHVEDMAMAERQELAEKWSDAADACAAVVRILTDEVVEVEATA